MKLLALQLLPRWNRSAICHVCSSVSQRKHVSILAVLHPRLERHGATLRKDFVACGGAMLIYGGGGSSRVRVLW